MAGWDPKHIFHMYMQYINSHNPHQYVSFRKKHINGIIFERKRVPVARSGLRSIYHGNKSYIYFDTSYTYSFNLISSFLN